MTTTTCGKTTFLHHSDLSGDVTMTYEGDENRYTIPANDLLEFVANYVRERRIAVLENMTIEGILGIPAGPSYFPGRLIPANPPAATDQSSERQGGRLPMQGGSADLPCGGKGG